MLEITKQDSSGNRIVVFIGPSVEVIQKTTMRGVVLYGRMDCSFPCPINEKTSFIPQNGNSEVPKFSQLNRTIVLPVRVVVIRWTKVQ